MPDLTLTNERLQELERELWDLACGGPTYTKRHALWMDARAAIRALRELQARPAADPPADGHSCATCGWTTWRYMDGKPCNECPHPLRDVDGWRPETPEETAHKTWKREGAEAGDRLLSGEWTREQWVEWHDRRRAERAAPTPQDAPAAPG